MHAGTIYGRRDIRPLVLAIERLRQEKQDIVFDQWGDMDQADSISEWIRERDLAPYVKLHPRVSQAEAHTRMSAAGALLLMQSGTQTQIPAKVFEMMLFHKPLLMLGDEGATARLMRGCDLGPIASATNVDEISAALRKLIAMRDFDSTSSDREEILGRFDGRLLTEKLASLLQEVAQPSRQ